MHMVQKINPHPQKQTNKCDLNTQNKNIIKTTSFYANLMKQQNNSESVATTFPAKLLPAQ